MNDKAAAYRLGFITLAILTVLTIGGFGCRVYADIGLAVHHCPVEGGRDCPEFHAYRAVMAGGRSLNERSIYNATSHDDAHAGGT